MNYLSIRTPVKQKRQATLSKRSTLLNFISKRLSRRKTEAKSTRKPKRAANPFKVATPSSSSDQLHREHLFATFQAMKLVQQLPPVDLQQLVQKQVQLPAKTLHRRLAVFDLDETLVHCTNKLGSADFTVKVQLPSGKKVTAGINVRPYARECLQAASEDFEVVVFTASQQAYADKVLDVLDPAGTFIHHRLYRDTCIFTGEVYVKDLRVFVDRPVEDIVIIDNSAYSFGYQLENGIPIISWYNDPHDNELHKLVYYLKQLAHCEDLRTFNRNNFHLASFHNDYVREYLHVSKD